MKKLDYKVLLIFGLFFSSSESVYSKGLGFVGPEKLFPNYDLLVLATFIIVPASFMYLISIRSDLNLPSFDLYKEFAVLNLMLIAGSTFMCHEIPDLFHTYVWKGILDRPPMNFMHDDSAFFAKFQVVIHSVVMVLGNLVFMVHKRRNA